MKPTRRWDVPCAGPPSQPSLHNHPAVPRYSSEASQLNRDVPLQPRPELFSDPQNQDKWQALVTWSRWTSGWDLTSIIPPQESLAKSDSRILVPKFMQLLPATPFQRSGWDLHNLRISLWILGLTNSTLNLSRAKMSTRIPGKKLCRQDWRLIRTAMLRPGWNVVGPEANYLISAWVAILARANILSLIETTTAKPFWDLLISQTPSFYQLKSKECHQRVSKGCRRASPSLL